MPVFSVHPMTVASLDGDGGLCEAEVYHTQHAVDAVCKAFMWALCDFYVCVGSNEEYCVDWVCS